MKKSSVVFVLILLGLLASDCITASCSNSLLFTSGTTVGTAVDAIETDVNALAVHVASFGLNYTALTFDTTNFAESGGAGGSTAGNDQLVKLRTNMQAVSAKLQAYSGVSVAVPLITILDADLFAVKWADFITDLCSAVVSMEAVRTAKVADLADALVLSQAVDTYRGSVTNAVGTYALKAPNEFYAYAKDAESATGNYSIVTTENANVALGTATGGLGFMLKTDADILYASSQNLYDNVALAEDTTTNATITTSVKLAFAQESYKTTVDSDALYATIETVTALNTRVGEQETLVQSEMSTVTDSSRTQSGETNGTGSGSSSAKIANILKFFFVQCFCLLFVFNGMF